MRFTVILQDGKTLSGVTIQGASNAGPDNGMTLIFYSEDLPTHWHEVAARDVVLMYRTALVPAPSAS